MYLAKDSIVEINPISLLPYHCCGEAGRRFPNSQSLLPTKIPYFFSGVRVNPKHSRAPTRPVSDRLKRREAFYQCIPAYQLLSERTSVLGYFI